MGRSRLARAAITLTVLLASLSGCREVRPDGHVQATYDQTGTLRLLTYDLNGNAKPDTWSYMDGSRVVRRHPKSSTSWRA